MIKNQNVKMHFESQKPPDPGPIPHLGEIAFFVSGDFVPDSA